MKLKLFFFPLAFAIAITVIIGYIWPEVQRASGLRQTVLQKQQELTQAQKKKENIGRLVQSINGAQEDESLILRYLPFERDEEYVINSVSQFAARNGVSVVNLTVATANQLQQQRPTRNANAEENDEQTSRYGITFAVTGEYANLKAFLRDAYRLERMHNLASVSVKREESEESGGNVVITATVNYVPHFYAKRVVSPLAQRPIFTQEEFDYNVAALVREHTAKNVSQLSVGSEGRANPFLP